MVSRATGAQALALDEALRERGDQVDRAIEIEVPAEEVVRRMSGRWVCQEQGHPYNETTNPPQVPGRCDIDGSPLVQREDDRPETVRARLDVQLSSLREVLDHYARSGILRSVDGTRPIDEVAAEVLAAAGGSKG